ncbi:MAG: HDIG domain-containing protein [Thermodesulfovibrionales bacterium]|nr:HDIG domain-containing protein [Thermodesulfovibrionales bacterium]
MKIDPIFIIQKYYPKSSKTYEILLSHSKAVTEKALQIANRLKDFKPDINFIEEAAMLHDIGIFQTFMPEIGCLGEHPYICHGHLGYKILQNEGLPLHAFVCERHVGLGLTIRDIKKNQLPLPLKNMTPITLEEKIICFADKFYSKKEGKLTVEKPIEEVKKIVSRYGHEKLLIFEEWLKFFNGKYYESL